ncbi:MAG: RidA family protein [Bryobacterales bacterium]|nr:RidA family protein [Bryobacterales bacterium]
MPTALSILLALTLLPAALDAQKKKKKPKIEITQTLEVLPDPPASVTVETAKLEFLASPLSGKGLLSQQIRDALKSLRAQAGSRPIVKIRAFVSGTGDQRRVASIVSETFAEKKQPLPAVSTIQVGQLGLEGAQIVLEAVVTNRKSVNPHGLAFLSGMGGVGPEPPEKISPMLDKAIADLTRAARAAGSEPGDVTRVTCLLSSSAPISEVRSRIAAAFPSAVLTAVQAERLHDKSLAECEAVARLRKNPAAALVLLNPPDMNPSPMYSKVALVGSDKVILTGAQLAFHSEDKDVQLAFQRMAKVLEAAHSSMKYVAFSSLYSLTNSMSAKIRAIRFDHYDKTRPPASTLLLFEGLPSMDASFAIELVAVPQ